MKSKSSFRDVFNKWIEASTAHGISNIFLNKNWFLKFFWILCVLSSVGYCIFNLSRTLNDFLDFNIGIHSISDCIFLQKSENSTNAKIFMKGLKKNALENLEKNKSLSDILEEINFNLKRIDTIRKHGFNIDEMLVNCQFNRFACTKNDFEYFMLAEFGNCYKFNSDTKTPGKKNGLRLELYTGTLDKDLDLVKSSGIHLFIHNHSTVIFSESDSINLSNGFETDIVVSQQHSYKLSKPHSNCIKDPTSFNSFESDLYKKSIELYGIYQQKTCLIMCYHEYIKMQCGCYFSDALGVTFNSSCNASLINCSKKAYENFQNSAKSLECFDLCPIECETIYFNI
ncbi:amiloride-sensitive sodium channel subunit delta [Brachionus plicatilis]|uniref:Amiloride-sensitive sodium channel subunit delta n=1 Tax=Brachionus plicatilis TaxID=10195 RepID=A0A3M7Q5H8_BRAPC|nr:amiloride-sensitive sodium channel subunit delta [Brachionus plicatilis]